MKRGDLLNRGAADTPIAAACWECSALLLCCTSQLYRGTCVVTSQTSHTRLGVDIYDVLTTSCVSLGSGECW